MVLVASAAMIFAAWRILAAQQEQEPGAAEDSEGWGESTWTDEPVQETNFLEDAVNSITNAISGNDIASVIEAGKGYIVVLRPDGTKARLVGVRAWRNNNPGNLEYKPFTIRMGAVGTDGRFAVFPTYEMGRKAKEALIFENSVYKNLSLTEAIYKYAPPVENETGWYQNTILASVGNANKPMNSYTPSERVKIMNAMERVEGYKPGTVQVLA